MASRLIDENDLKDNYGVPRSRGLVCQPSPEKQCYEATIDAWIRNQATYEDMQRAYCRMKQKEWHEELRDFLVYLLLGK